MPTLVTIESPALVIVSALSASLADVKLPPGDFELNATARISAFARKSADYTKKGTTRVSWKALALALAQKVNTDTLNAAVRETLADDYAEPDTLKRTVERAAENFVGAAPDIVSSGPLKVQGKIEFEF
jgi:hypothetical protein